MTEGDRQRGELESFGDLPELETLMNLAQAFLPFLGSMPRLTTNPPVSGEGVDTAEARIRKAETRYQALVERIPVVTFIVSFNQRQSEIYVSSQVEKML